MSEFLTFEPVSFTSIKRTGICGGNKTFSQIKKKLYISNKSIIFWVFHVVNLAVKIQFSVMKIYIHEF